MIIRPIDEHEVAVIRAVLETAAKAQVRQELLDSLATLHVVRQCRCGCDSVDFAEHDSEHPSQPIGDGLGETPTGGTVGIIIWGTEDAVTGIEVYDMGAGDWDIRLPVTSSIRPFSPSSL